MILCTFRSIPKSERGWDAFQKFCYKPVSKKRKGVTKLECAVYTYNLTQRILSKYAKNICMLFVKLVERILIF